MSTVVTESGCAGVPGELEVLRGPPVTWEITVDRPSRAGADAGLDLVASVG